ncbi:FAD-binding and (Fe-S)-binding domain-containing protein [uncultured Eudoraea sp.]|uniref:FAD-binding and (Fe-S)-binding domain-containing protein n=1 Tax=uncultured Eudoraea sp. TaxID=1035614 RepID=UPI00261BDBCE|nr:FAD-binding and (Fe-S)-binding domain-containing protein [uncultured Eudoraea sp.]
MDKNLLISLRNSLSGSLQFDKLSKALYATDASVYRKEPIAVAFPKDEDDIVKLILFAREQHVGLIPRTAGTSLAGQCVGEGIVVDVSRHHTKILKLDTEKKTVKVQPGVIRDELNQYLKDSGLFFGPNTSTSNRCMIGGMVGNNSSGTTSIQYGVTRDKVISLKAILSDGSQATFESITPSEYRKKMELNTLEGTIYRELHRELQNKNVQQQIKEEFPKEGIHRRNTGYAVDELLRTKLFGGIEEEVNLCKLLSGSEGTLAFTTEITLQLDDIPPRNAAMVVTHYKDLESCLQDVAPVMHHNLYLCEMMDKVILDCTKNNREQLSNRFFVEGDPAALLMLELKDDTKEGLERKLQELIKTIESSGLSYANPILRGADINKAIALRKAGLGLLGNMVGDRKAVACIEDTAVALNDLKDFIGEFTEIMKSYGQEAVYYAHAGAGELHLRPILNLKKAEDVSLFRLITTDVAKLTKKYGGSFSGEHGDGIVRAEFIPMMLGDDNYKLLTRIKSYFDPDHIFNPGKIVDAYRMDEALRYEIDRHEPDIKTLFDFSDSEGILKAAEKCNGSGDCRKTHKAPGGMCPSYQATKNEKDTTRGRANVLREVLTNSVEKNRFDSEELKDVFDLCLSCKACASECPSNVDVSTLKSEFLFQYQESRGYAIRNKIFAHNTRLNAIGSIFPKITNTIYNSRLLSSPIKIISGIALERTLPNVSNYNLVKHLQNTKKQSVTKEKEVLLFIDEFTRYMDTAVGKDAIDLLLGLGYDVHLFQGESGRALISKGFLKEAKKLAEKNIGPLHDYARRGVPILGIEPSAILTFRDEYKRFHLDTEIVNAIADHTFLIEEFLSNEIKNGAIMKEQFTTSAATIKIHNHCHQKALSDQKVTFDILNLPENYSVSIIASGCCGMAGSFGYEKEHYKTSMQIGELKLFPSIRKSDENVIIAANGTSCRHQIADGTKRIAQHPVTILKNAMNVT